MEKECFVEMQLEFFVYAICEIVASAVVSSQAPLKNDEDESQVPLCAANKYENYCFVAKSCKIF